MADKSLIVQAVKTYKYSKSFYFKTPENLKPKQIPGAIKKWAKTVPERDIVALMDTTLFDSGKEGFLVTEKEFIGHILYDVRIPLDDMVRCSHNDSYVTVYYRGRKEERFYASIFTEDLCNFFDRLVALTVEKKQKEEAARLKAEQEAAARRKAQEEEAARRRAEAAAIKAEAAALEAEVIREKAAREKAAREAAEKKAAQEKAAKEAAEKKAAQEALARILQQRKDAEARREKAAQEQPQDPGDPYAHVSRVPNPENPPADDDFIRGSATDDTVILPRLSFLDAEGTSSAPSGPSQPEAFAFCPYCGTVNPLGVRMCAACGTFLPEDQASGFRGASGPSLSDFLLEDFEGDKSGKNW